MKYATLFAMLVALIENNSAQAQDNLPSLLRGVRIDQRLDEQVPLNLIFRDEAGRSVALRDYFGNKPVILVLAYYRCPRLCTEVLNGLLDSLTALRTFDVGNQFNVVTVSFDPRETADLANAKKRTYVDNYGRPGAEDGWHFLTGDKPSIDALTEAVGFHYNYDPNADQFAHASGIMVLTAQGRVARYFYGIKYPPRDLRLGLVEASLGRIGSPVDQVLLFCFHYDPATGKYGAAVLNIVRLGGVVTVLALGAFFIVMWRRERRHVVTAFTRSDGGAGPASRAELTNSLFTK
jgi:protein SCO1